MDGSILPRLPLVESAQYAATPTIATSATAPTAMPTIMPTLAESPPSSEDDCFGGTGGSGVAEADDCWGSGSGVTLDEEGWGSGSGVTLEDEVSGWGSGDALDDEVPGSG